RRDAEQGRRTALPGARGRVLRVSVLRRHDRQEDAAGKAHRDRRGFRDVPARSRGRRGGAGLGVRPRAAFPRLLRDLDRSAARSLHAHPARLRRAALDSMPLVRLARALVACALLCAASLAGAQNAPKHQPLVGLWLVEAADYDAWSDSLIDLAA